MRIAAVDHLKGRYPHLVYYFSGRPRTAIWPANIPNGRPSCLP